MLYLVKQSMTDVTSKFNIRPFPLVYHANAGVKGLISIIYKIAKGLYIRIIYSVLNNFNNTK